MGRFGGWFSSPQLEIGVEDEGIGSVNHFC
jgi:hypothetical protein